MTLTDIKRIGIRKYLGARGINPQRERGNRAMYLSSLRRENTASFSVNFDENVWYDHGIGVGGSIIDLVARMENCSIGEAIRWLENEVLIGNLSGTGVGGGVLNTNVVAGTPLFSYHRSTSHENTTTSAQHPEPDRSRIEIVSVGELKHPALVDYLRERCIDLAVARKYCREARYSIGDREYFAIGFRNEAGGWELRNRNFKGSSTPKNITTLNNGSDTVMVFEGFIDFLSYISLKQNPSPTIDIAVLNSVTNRRCGARAEVACELCRAARRSASVFCERTCGGRYRSSNRTAPSTLSSITTMPDERHLPICANRCPARRWSISRPSIEITKT